MKTFEQWDIDDVERTFGLKRVLESSLLTSWVQGASQQPALSNDFQMLVESMRMKLFLYGDAWNEDELKFHIIAPLVNLVDFTIEGKNIHAFTQRTLTATVKDIVLSGRVDFIVATGKAKPHQPFFFLHEYKKERTGESDPRAQLLVEMLAARELNAIHYPLYGCYVVGRNWFFLVLEGSIYAESKQYTASDEDDIVNIYSILREAKAIITRLAEQVV